MLEVLDEFLLTYKHLPNPGLKIAIEKFENVLKNQGLEEINLKTLTLILRLWNALR